MRGSTFERIQQEIAEGKLGIARDRLHGLVQAYPLDFSLRSLLGDVYWKLGYPREAGRFWFFDLDPDADKRAAIAMFVEECANDPARIFLRLKLRCSPEEIAASGVRETVDRLVDECRRQGKPIKTWQGSEPISPKTGWFAIGCYAVSILILVLTVIGLATVLNWMF